MSDDGRRTPERQHTQETSPSFVPVSLSPNSLAQTLPDNPLSTPPHSLIRPDTNSRSLTPPTSALFSAQSFPSQEQQPAASSATRGNLPNTARNPIGEGHRVGEPRTRRSRRRRQTEGLNIGSSDRQAMVRSTSSSDDSEHDSDSSYYHVYSIQPPVSHGTADPYMRSRRTRRLTTPRQAAALYNLLAQTQFPSREMREEIGREIDMTPRKVQIWFQNQRQKIRRPKSEGQALHSSDQDVYHERHETSAPSSHSESLSRISGSTRLERRHQQPDVTPTSARPTLPPLIDTSGMLQRSRSPSSTLSAGGTTRALEPRERLVSPSSVLSPFGAGSHAHSGRPQSPPPRGASSAASRAIPRPFTMEPGPMWSPSTYSPHQSSGGQIERSLSPFSPSARPRYDPVRSSFSQSPSPPGGSSGRKHHRADDK